MSADALVVDLLDVVGLDVGVGVADGPGRNGSADSGQGGPVRIRGGSSTADLAIANGPKSSTSVDRQFSGAPSAPTGAFSRETFEESR